MQHFNIISTMNQINNWLTKYHNILINYLINLIFVFIIFLIGLVISRIISRVIQKQCDATIANFISATLRYSIMLFTVIAILNYVGIQTTPLITIIGTASLTIGLALQNSLSNFAAGLLLVTLNYFRTGDYVDIAGTTGTVVIIKIFSTTLRTYDGKIIILPNNKVITSNIINFSKEPNKLIDIKISVNYNADIQQVKSIITNILLSDNRIIQDQNITVGLKSLNASSIDFTVQAWVLYKDQKNTTFDLLEKTKIALDEYKVKTLNL